VLVAGHSYKVLKDGVDSSNLVRTIRVDALVEGDARAAGNTEIPDGITEVLTAALAPVPGRCPFGILWTLPK
jgi:hypothetical protein